MKRLLITVVAFTAMAITGYAAIYDDAVLHVDFGNDSVNDVNNPGSTGMATDVTFNTVCLNASNSNCRVAVFNGSTSGIDYGLGAGNELYLYYGGYSDPLKLTYHIRVRFNTVSAANQFLMGRHCCSTGTVSAIEVTGNDVRGYISTDGSNNFGHSATNILSTGIFYDIFFRFNGKYQALNDGFFRTSIYDADHHALVAHGPNWGTANRGIYSGTAAFWIGRRGDYSGSENPLNGLVDQVNVWHRTLSEAEMLAMSIPGLPRGTIMLIK